MVVRSRSSTPNSLVKRTDVNKMLGDGDCLGYCYQKALAITEEHKLVVLAIAQELIDHPNRTLNSSEINALIVPALAGKAAADEMERRSRWAGVETSAADFVAFQRLL
jgi:hypothetical protein